MTTRRLTIAFRTVGQGTEESLRANRTLDTAIAEDGTFLVQGDVEVVSPNGLYEVNIVSLGQRQTMSSVTDEPIERGGLVWISKTKAGQWVIHGSVKN